MCVGDSAGGNLLIAMALKCAQEGLFVSDGLCLYVFRLYWGEDCVCWRQCGWEPHDSHGP